jgi:hypothetical protein
MLAATVYILCALTSLACAVLLWRGFSQSRARFLMWSSLCFVGLAINNILLFADRVVFPDVTHVAGVPFNILRSVAALIGLALLIYGLVWDAE